MGPLLGLLAAFLVACGFDAFIAKPMAMDGEDILGLSLCAAIATLLGSGLGDYLDTRRLQEPFNARLINALVLRNLLFAGVTGAFVATVVAYAGSTVPMSRAVAVQFAIVTALSGTVAYGELISRYRDTPGRLLSADPTVIYICVNIAAGTAALALVKDLHAVTSAEHKLVYETLLAGFGAIAFFRTSLFTIRVSGSDVGVGPSTLLKALLDSSDMMLNRWQALNRGAQVKIIMAGVDFAKAKAALPTMCFTLMNDFPAAVQSSVAEQIKKLADDTSMSDEAKVLILGIYLIQQVGTDVLDRAVRTLDTAIK